jgi:hypothetical protein
MTFWRLVRFAQRHGVGQSALIQVMYEPVSLVGYRDAKVASTVSKSAVTNIQRLTRTHKDALQPRWAMLGRFPAWAIAEGPENLSRPSFRNSL